MMYVILSEIIEFVNSSLSNKGIIVCLILSLSSCSNKDEQTIFKPYDYKSMDDFQVYITCPSGMMCTDLGFECKIPTFFNHAFINDSLHVLVLGEQINKLGKESFKVLGGYELEIAGKSIFYVVAKPKHSKNVSLLVETYHEWSVNEIEYKNLIDQWFRANCHHDSCRVTGWVNDLKAMHFLEAVHKTKTFLHGN